MNRKFVFIVTNSIIAINIFFTCINYINNTFRLYISFKSSLNSVSWRFISGIYKFVRYFLKFFNFFLIITPFDRFSLIFGFSINFSSCFTGLSFNTNCVVLRQFGCIGGAFNPISISDILNRLPSSSRQIVDVLLSKNASYL